MVEAGHTPDRGQRQRRGVRRFSEHEHALPQPSQHPPGHLVALTLRGLGRQRGRPRTRRDPAEPGRPRCPRVSADVLDVPRVPGGLRGGIGWRVVVVVEQDAVRAPPADPARQRGPEPAEHRLRSPGPGTQRVGVLHHLHRFHGVQRLHRFQVSTTSTASTIGRSGGRVTRLPCGPSARPPRRAAARPGSSRPVPPRRPPRYDARPRAVRRRAPDSRVRPAARPAR